MRSAVQYYLRVYKLKHAYTNEFMHVSKIFTYSTTYIKLIRMAACEGGENWWGVKGDQEQIEKNMKENKRGALTRLIMTVYYELKVINWSLRSPKRQLKMLWNKKLLLAKRLWWPGICELDNMGTQLFIGKRSHISIMHSQVLRGIEKIFSKNKMSNFLDLYLEKTRWHILARC